MTAVATASHKPHFASPLARAIARRSGQSVLSIAGSGPGGRVIAADVLKATVNQQVCDFEDMPTSASRRQLADRLTKSKQQIPHFYAKVECNVDHLLRVRADCNTKCEHQGLKLSVNDFVIYAASRALQDIPQLNTAYNDAAIRQHRHAHISIAVEMPSGLLTPVLKNAEIKDIATISREVKHLVEQARAGTLPAGACAGGSFTITNLGRLGVREFAAIINPPQAGILAVGSCERTPVVVGDHIGIATMMMVTLSADHRVIDGAVAARWLAAFKRHLENLTVRDVWKSSLFAP